ncbi:ABC transporter substrate-binding protein [Psychromonas sp. Urea-02u-13]|uniref:ABC transporter substrate-binding protein n=1 Tax=Psychromonas sp. Urea-02u-13 TaxID=2058326 RepID=UPI000C33CB1C|nr:ABC transporter substrate-binding protein [Psychromonas sp. Urea-02u-13]PKG38837.1 glycine/betaine ABC transporter substrate-binding protein [Psychromonas sp. Urea-02u-13]
MKTFYLLIITIILNLHSTSIQATERHRVKIIVNNWTSQVVLSYITGDIFKQMGYQVIYQPMAISEQWGALAYGVSDVQVEVWEGTMAEPFNRMVEDGLFMSAGEHSAKTREDWWYPDYIEKLCPGLPDWKALKACAPLFAREGSNQKGVYFAGPWEKPDEARIRALEMDFVVHTVENGDDLWVELEKSLTALQPIVLFNWTPNWVESRYQGKFVEFPAYDRKCETESSWGENKEFLYDCGNPKGGWLKKAASIQLKTEAKCAFNTLQNINFTNQQISAVSALVDVEKLSYQQAATRWLTENKRLWKTWIVTDCKL